MAIAFMADDGQSITCAQDAAMYNVFAGNKNFVIDGIGNNLAVSYNASSLQVTLGTGEGVIKGRHFNVSGTDTNITLSASTSGKLVVRYDLSQSGSNVVKFMAVSSTIDQDINGSGTKSDLVLGSYTTSASGVSAFTDERVIYSQVYIPTANYAETAGTATTATTATKLGSATVGGGKKPIYLSSGSPTAFTATEGGTAKPIYLNAGTLTAISDTVGSATKPVYLNAGTITAMSQTIGSATKPVYLNAGTITPLSGNIGATNQIVYINGGALTAGITIRSGTSTPANSLGNDGDIYIKYEA